MNDKKIEASAEIIKGISDALKKNPLFQLDDIIAKGRAEARRRKNRKARNEAANKLRPIRD